MLQPPKRYWSNLKKKLELEGSEAYEEIARLKIKVLIKKTIK